MGGTFFKKSFAILVMILFSVSVNAFTNNEPHMTYFLHKNTATDGTILYVGGDGPNNYTTIQSAINDVQDVATIFVYSGTYYEQLIINKPLALIGEDRLTTIIDANHTGDAITVTADHVTITGFTVQNGGKYEEESGIKIQSNYNTITENIIRENGNIRYNYKQGGLYLDNASYNDISNNIITQNREDGIYLHHATHNFIYNNEIYNNDVMALIANYSRFNHIVNNDIYENHCGMSFWPYSTYNTILRNTIHDHPGCGLAFKAYSDHNIIRYNTLVNNLEWGIMLGWGPTMYNTVEYNIITGTIGGQMNYFDGSALVLSSAFLNTIRNNNLADNNHDAHIENSLFNRWTQNYWESHTGDGPKLIKTSFYLPSNPDIRIPWFAFDLQPSSAQYDLYTYPLSVIHTNKGSMALELYTDKMPITSENFIRLAESSFFDGLVFHRAVDDFVIQGGGYTPNGKRKDSPYGTIVLEIHPEVTHVDGAISMARTSDPNSATSQFFICDTAQHRLDGNYSAFGVIIGVPHTLRSIAASETAFRYGLQDWPVEDIIMNKVVVFH